MLEVRLKNGTQKVLADYANHVVPPEVIVSVILYLMKSNFVVSNAAKYK